MPLLGCQDPFRKTPSSPVVQVDHPVEEEGPPGGASEPRRDELAAVGQEGVALGAREQAAAADVLQEDAAHGHWSPGLVTGHRGRSGWRRWWWGPPPPLTAATAG